MPEKNKIAVIDPAAGASGDMLLGALLDLGLDRKWLEDLPGRMSFDGVEVEISRVTRCSLAATKVTFRIGGATDDSDHLSSDHHGRHVSDLVALVRAADLSTDVKEKAVRAFRLIGEAEAAVHGMSPEEVHLHEVGAIDAVLDIVGVVEGFERLGVDAVYNLPVGLGDGWVSTAHGRLPVPAPATANILAGLDVVTGSPVRGEATTPTGAALLRVLSRGAPPEHWRIGKTGWGAGARDPEGYPNALRILLGDSSPESAWIEIIATDVDDLQPEYIEPMREALFAAGALECVVWPTQGKKGRVSFRIEAYSSLADADRIAEELFRHSTTAGIRRTRALRTTVARSSMSVELTPAVAVRVKVLEGPDRNRLKAEYDDVLIAAGKLGRPAIEIARQAEILAAQELEKVET